MITMAWYRQTFPTVDTIRDGNNWFAYVNNDPVNWIDLLRLETVYYYEKTDTIGNKSTCISIQDTNTYYSSDKDKLEKDRNDKIDNLSKTRYVEQAEADTFTIEDPKTGITITSKFGPIKQAELPSTSPKSDKLRKNKKDK